MKDIFKTNYPFSYPDYSKGIPECYCDTKSIHLNSSNTTKLSETLNEKLKKSCCCEIRQQPI